MYLWRHQTTTVCFMQYYRIYYYHDLNSQWSSHAVTIAQSAKSSQSHAVRPGWSITLQAPSEAASNHQLRDYSMALIAHIPRIRRHRAELQDNVSLRQLSDSHHTTQFSQWKPAHSQQIGCCCGLHGRNDAPPRLLMFWWCYRLIDVVRALQVNKSLVTGSLHVRYKRLNIDYKQLLLKKETVFLAFDIEFMGIGYEAEFQF